MVSTVSDGNWTNMSTECVISVVPSCFACIEAVRETRARALIALGSIGLLNMPSHTATHCVGVRSSTFTVPVEPSPVSAS
jgi:hypothetical protein